jgi:hypothetical protein
MKKMYTLLVLLTISSGFLLAQVKPTSSPVLAKGPVITFESLVIDYGTIAHNSERIREFKFTNTGSEDLIISECGRSCGCTTPDCPRGVFAPGESGIIKVDYATERVGDFMKTVTVSSNATNSNVTLTIKGKVLPD